MIWRTRLTKSFPCTVPIVGAPMAGVSGGILAAETCRAGALGFVEAGHLTSMQDLDDEVWIFWKHAQGDASLALGFIGHSCLKNGPNLVESVLKKHKPKVVQFAFPAVVDFDDGSNNVQLAKKHGAQVMAQVGTVAEAKQALQAGVDCLIAQGSEAGGHGVRPDLGSGTLSLSARLVSLSRESSYNPLVLAAGGIVDGRGLAAALALGCDGVVLGTRLWASQEAKGHDSFKEQLASPLSGPDQVIRTTVMDQIGNSYSATPWPKPYDSTGNLRNKTTEKWHGREAELAHALTEMDNTVVKEYKNASATGDFAIGTVYSGKGVGDIHSVDGAYDIVCRVSEEAMAIVQGMPSLLEPTANESNGSKSNIANKRVAQENGAEQATKKVK